MAKNDNKIINDFKAVSQNNRKKLSISLSISETLLKKMTHMVESGDFATISDLVYVSVCELLGILSYCETNENFNLEAFLDTIPEDIGSKVSVSATVNPFINSKLKQISKQTNKNQSAVIRKAILYFMEYYNNSCLPTSSYSNVSSFPMSEIELKKFIIQTIQELDEQK